MKVILDESNLFYVIFLHIFKQSNTQQSDAEKNTNILFILMQVFGFYFLLQKLSLLHNKLCIAIE